MDELCQVHVLMDAAAEGQFVSAPVNVTNGGRRPGVALLDILNKWWSMCGVSDRRLVMVGDSALVDLELGAGMGEQQYMQAGATMLVLEIASSLIGIDIELGWKG
jgi:hypothetical protein